MKKHAEQEEAIKNTQETAKTDQITPVSAETPAADTAPVSPVTEKPAPEADKNSVPDLSCRVAELEKLNAELQDQYLRKAADFDNYRKRMIREKQDAIDFANTNLLVDLVQILDDFDRAIAAGGIPEDGTPIAAFTDGVTMIRNQLGGMLQTKYGLMQYQSKGELFDPSIHEAVGTIPSPDVKEPTVVEEFTKGYKLKDRVIRVAKVMVSMPAENQNP